jgi:hypothetical protein
VLLAVPSICRLSLFFAIKHRKERQKQNTKKFHNRKKITKKPNKFHAINDGAGSALNCKDRREIKRVKAKLERSRKRAKKNYNNDEKKKLPKLLFSHPLCLLLLFSFHSPSPIKGKGMECVSVYLCPSRLLSQLSSFFFSLLCCCRSSLLLLFILIVLRLLFVCLFACVLIRNL